MCVLFGQLLGWFVWVDCLLFGEFLLWVDVLILYCLLIEDICGMFGVVELVLMKFGVFLVNIVCGGLVDEQVLVDVLCGGYLGGVVIDVFSVELLRNGNLLLVFDILCLIVIFYNVWGSCEVWQCIVG